MIRAGEGEWELSCCLPRDRNYDRRPAQQGPRNEQRHPVRQRLRSSAIFTDKSGEGHDLLPLEQPSDLGVQRVGDGLAQGVSGFPAAVYDPTEIRLMNANHLGKAVLADPCLINRQLQIRLNLSLDEIHFLLASLDFAALMGP